MIKSTNKSAAALFGAVALVLVSTTMASAANCSYVFTKTLKTGSTGAEVMNLQKVLNMNAGTTVSASGAGSAGNETMTFGGATRAAVIKFQAANSVSPTSGLVGPLTRAKLNAMCTGTGTTTPTTPGTTGPVSVSNGAAANSVLVASQSGAVLANFNLSGTGTISNIELMRTGVSTNSTLTNVYLYDGATRLTDSASVTSDGKVRFNNVNLSVAGSRVLTVRADIAALTGGQSVGVMFSSYTVSGASSATAVSGVMGNNLTIATLAAGQVATVALTDNQTAGIVAINAGLVNQNVWDVTANVGVRSVFMKGLTFKYIGSAPTDALANLALFVDGVKVGNNGSINNGIVVFDMMSAPLKLEAGNRQIQLRADIVKGTARSFQFQVQNSSDYMFEDSNLAGVFVTPTYTSGDSNGNNFTINKGNLIINQEPSFVDTKVVGGATNATVGKYKVQAFGEDVKVETVTVDFPTATGFLPLPGAGSTSILQNVTLYANGQAVGSTQTWGSITSLGVVTAGPITFNLGSSMIIPAGSSQMLEVKADMRSGLGVSYTAGTLTAQLSTTLVRGQSSSETLTNVTAVNSRLLTVTSGTATFAKTGGFFGQTVSPNSTNVKIGSFTVQAGDAEDLTVTNLALTLTPGAGMTMNNLTNLRVTDSSSVVFNPVAGTDANNFTMTVSVPKSASKTFDVTVDLGSSQGVTATIQTDAKISYRGANTGSLPAVAATGVAMTANNGAIALGDITRLSSSPVQKLALGGTTGAAAVTYNIKTTGGVGSATITDMKFAVSSADHVTKVTVGGKSATTIAGFATINGLSILVPTGAAGIDLPVTVDYGTVATPGGTPSQLTALTTLDLTEIKFNSGTSVTTLPVTGKAAANQQLVASKPTVVVPATTLAGLNLTTENKIGEVTVSADSKGNVTLKKLTFAISNSGFTAAPTAFSGASLKDGSSIITDADCSTLTAVTGGVCNFTVGYTLAAGTSKTFSLYATMTGAANSGTNKAQLSTKVTGTTTAFNWIDVNGSATVLDGSNIENFPTTSYTVTQ